MSQLIVLGAQWGDEGKGKIIDFLTEFSDIVVRFQGGGNAGHTLSVDGKKTILHFMPSGILHSRVISVIASGVVTDLKLLSEEINDLNKNDLIVTKDNFKISYDTHLIFDYHKLIDKYREEQLGSDKFSFSQKGVGPAYEDKIALRGIRFQDFLDKKRFDSLLKSNIYYYNFQFEHFFGKEKINYDDIVSEFDALREELAPFGEDVRLMLYNASLKGEIILFEGADGCLLDINHGTYPYVTTSSTTSGGAFVGTGFSNFSKTSALGVFKAYSTRVGDGYFPTEIDGSICEKIREAGKEYESGNLKRRIGWLDLVALKYVIRVNGLTSLAMTKLDVLSGLDEIKIATAYKYHDEVITDFTNNIEIFENIEPIYQTYDGWEDEIPLETIRVYDDLPVNAQKFISAIEAILDIPIEIISVGPDRKETIVINNPFRHKE